MKPAPIGEVFGGWTVLGEAPPGAAGRSRWRVQCACGATCVRIASKVRLGGQCVSCRNKAAQKRIARNGGVAGSAVRRAKALRGGQ